MKKETDVNQPDWDAYVCYIDDKPASIATDLNLRHHAPIPNCLELIQVGIKLKNPEENGLPKGHELEMLSLIEETLGTALKTDLQAICVGRAAFHGMRYFFFYAPSSISAAAILARSFSNFPGYTIDLHCCRETNWATYFDFLFPQEWDFQRIKTRKILSQLAHSEDDSNSERPVNHWVGFKLGNDRANFLCSSTILGFSCLEQIESRSEDEEFPFKILISKPETTDQDHIEDVVFLVWELTKELYGRYEGWDTTVISQNRAA